MIDPYLLALAATIVIELLIVVLFRSFVAALRDRPVRSTCVCLNLLTHPLAALVCFFLSLAVLPVEVVVVVTESLGYRFIARIPVKWSVTLALVTNLVSMIVGFLFA